MTSQAQRSSFFKTNKTLSVSLLILGGILLVEALLFLFFGRALIVDMYNEKAHPILNGLIMGRTLYTVDFYLQFANQMFVSILLLTPCVFAMLASILQFKRVMQSRLLRPLFDSVAQRIDAIPEKSLWFWIALAAGLGLFAELTIIRFHSSYAQLFAYFKNVSLLSCFLGLGIGYGMRAKEKVIAPLFFPLFGVQVLFLAILRNCPIEHLLHNPIPEQFTFGVAQAKTLLHIVIAYLFLALIFVFNMFCFIPLGQLASRLMKRQESVRAYGWNLLGSIVGIVLFSVISFLWLPPLVWIMVVAFCFIPFISNNKASVIASVVMLLSIAVFLSLPFRVSKVDVYSPYQLISLSSSKGVPVLKVSNTYHQSMIDFDNPANLERDSSRALINAYTLAYYFTQDPSRILVVGSGMGNDVAAANRNTAARVDAVEIDPAILRYGIELHPQFPYQQENVTRHVNDARAYMQHTNESYDLIVYGALDSHALLSGLSGGVRLDSYMYTVEAFEDAKSILSNAGVVSLSFGDLDPGLAKKIFLMLAEVYGEDNVLVFNSSRYIFIAGMTVRDRLPAVPDHYNNVTADIRARDEAVDVSTDNWPFFYMPTRKYPLSYCALILFFLGLSVFYIYQFAPSGKQQFSFPCFFLGAGFMLIEAKGITELSLVYGSTWVVVSIVILAILTLAYLANLYIARAKNLPSVNLCYLFLILAVAAGYGITFFDKGLIPQYVSWVIMPAVVTLPLFFSGFVFSTELRRLGSVDVALSSNLFGAMLGGFLEYNSMFFGFRFLYILAGVLYCLAYAFSAKQK